MAVITRYVVVRNGVELDRIFSDKKEADAYDKMLDAADNLSALIREGDLDIELDDAVIDRISVFLAQNGPEVTRILKGIKLISAESKIGKDANPVKTEREPEPEPDKKKAADRKPGRKKK